MKIAHRAATASDPVTDRLQYAGRLRNVAVILAGGARRSAAIARI